MKLLVVLANTLWFLSMLPGWIRFQLSSFSCKKRQRRLVDKLLVNNRDTSYLKEFTDDVTAQLTIEQLPLVDYADITEYIQRIMNGEGEVLTKEPVLLLEPTSGSTSVTKLIPYTRQLQKQFNMAINPWIFSLFYRFPALLNGKHYWSISPATNYNSSESKVPIGFNRDEDYLGILARFLTDRLFPVPGLVKQITGGDSFRYITTLFLAREKNLRLVSIWNPTFLTVLCEYMERHADQLADDIESGSISSSITLNDEIRILLQNRLIPDSRRAGQVRKAFKKKDDRFAALWPKLTLISCWDEGMAAQQVDRLRQLFPGVYIQGKGLIATEGIVTIPIGADDKKVLLPDVHFYEFIDLENGSIHGAGELTTGSRYSVIITTGGGLYRYKLHDIIEVSGYFRSLPVIRFIGREGIVSDLVGEKISEYQVSSIFNNLRNDFPGIFTFIMLLPQQLNMGYRYVIVVDSEWTDNRLLEKLRWQVEKGLLQNFHYRHARNIGQLQDVAMLSTDGEGLVQYMKWQSSRGMREGDIKTQALVTDTEFIDRYCGTWHIGTEAGLNN